MRRYLTLTMVAGLIATQAYGGIFDRIKQTATQKIEKTVDEAIESAKPEQTQQPQKENIPSPTNQTAPDTPIQQPMTSVDDLYGQWEGVVTPVSSGYNMMSGITLYITITPEFAGLRVSGAGTSCLAQLEPTGTLGQYQAAFIDETQSCGSEALVSFAAGGKVSVNWKDMPDAANKTYTGKLTKKTSAYERRWSTTADELKQLNIIGLRLGMTYEEVLDYLESEHPDLEKELKTVNDQGTQSIVLGLTQKNAKKLGPTVFEEQITLVFESFTPEEMEVEQDPEVLKAIEERDKIIKQRDEMIVQQRVASRSRTRSRNMEPSENSQDPLPEIPEMPKLRPPGAEAELVVISRQIQYGNRQGPHPENVINALAGKYGTPSVRIEKQAGVGDNYLLGWIYDASGNFVTNGEGSDCDLLSRTGYELKEVAHYYSVLNNLSGIFNLVSISTQCGLTLAADIRTENDGSVWKIATTVYDQQRLLGDEWYRTWNQTQAMVAQQKAKSNEIEQRDVPDF